VLGTNGGHVQEGGGIVKGDLKKRHDENIISRYNRREECIVPNDKGKAQKRRSKFKRYTCGFSLLPALIMSAFLHQERGAFFLGFSWGSHLAESQPMRLINSLNNTRSVAYLGKI
jgi:hypothetical protein